MGVGGRQHWLFSQNRSLQQPPSPQAMAALLHAEPGPPQLPLLEPPEDELPELLVELPIEPEELDEEEDIEAPELEELGVPELLPLEPTVETDDVEVVEPLLEPPLVVELELALPWLELLDWPELVPGASQMPFWQV